MFVCARCCTIIVCKYIAASECVRLRMSPDFSIQLLSTENSNKQPLHIECHNLTIPNSTAPTFDGMSSSPPQLAPSSDQSSAPEKVPCTNLLEIANPVNGVYVFNALKDCKRLKGPFIIPHTTNDRPPSRLCCFPIGIVTPTACEHGRVKQVWATFEETSSSLDVEISIRGNDKYDFVLFAGAQGGQTVSIFDPLNPLLAGQACLQDEKYLMAYMAFLSVCAFHTHASSCHPVPGISKKHILPIVQACRRISAAACVQLRTILDACSEMVDEQIDPRLRLGHYCFDEFDLDYCGYDTDVLVFGHMKLWVPIALREGSEPMAPVEAN